MNVTANRYSGTKIGDVLKAQGRRQDWLAAQVGVSKATVTRWISGAISIREEHATKVATVLGVPFFVVAESRNSDGSTRKEDAAA